MANFLKKFTKLELLQYEELNVKIVYMIVHRRLTPICTQLGLSDRVKKPAMYLPISQGYLKGSKEQMQLPKVGSK